MQSIVIVWVEYNAFEDNVYDRNFTTPGVQTENDTPPKSTKSRDSKPWYKF